MELNKIPKGVDADMRPDMLQEAIQQNVKMCSKQYTKRNYVKE